MKTLEHMTIEELVDFAAKKFNYPRDSYPSKLGLNNNYDMAIAGPMDAAVYTARNNSRWLSMKGKAAISNETRLWMIKKRDVIELCKLSTQDEFAAAIRAKIAIFIALGDKGEES